ncbi:MAG: hypothetical protein JW818_19960, partial [Pirellulales bacterium]|nr:hypothetical protein [Pirellulales bacterium]
QRAVSLPRERREPVWQEAHAVIAQYLQRQPTNPRRLLLDLQDAMIHLSQGELARQEAELSANPEPLLDEARVELRSGIRGLADIEPRVDQAIRESGRGPDGLSVDSLRSLQKNVTYERARAWRNQAQCFAAGTPDRTHGLTQAAKLLDGLARLDTADPLAWKSRLDRVACYRLLGDGLNARRELVALMGKDPPPGVALRAQAEGLRLALALGEYNDIKSLLDLPRKRGGRTSAELDFARLEACLASWQRATDAKDNAGADAWQARATDALKTIEHRAEPYWTRRAESLLARYFRAASTSGDLDTLIRAAKSSFLAGRPDDAVATYDRAVELATKQGDTQQAFELARIAAMIQQKRRKYESALERFRALALDRSAHPDAGEAHLDAIRNAATLAKESKSGGLDRYADLLQEHVRTWPRGASANQARWWMGRLRQHEKDWPGAIAAYSAISQGDARRADAVRATGECYRAWLAAQRAAGQPAEPLAAKAAAWFESLVADADGRLPSQFDPAARNAALEAARLWLEAPPKGFARAEVLLRAVLAEITPAAEWKSHAEGLLALSLAGQGRGREAEALLDRAGTADLPSQIGLLLALERIAREAQPPVRRAVAPLALRLIERIDTRLEQLDPTSRLAVGRVRAQSLRDAGRKAEALRWYASLARQYPRDAEIQEGYADLLASYNDRRTLDEALARWRDVEKGSPSGSDRWFRARYAVADLHLRLGNPKKAEKIITLLEVLHPDMGGDAQRKQFLDLLERCRMQRPRK